MSGRDSEDAAEERHPDRRHSQAREELRQDESDPAVKIKIENSLNITGFVRAINRCEHRRRNVGCGEERRPASDARHQLGDQRVADDIQRLIKVCPGVIRGHARAKANSFFRAPRGRSTGATKSPRRRSS